MSTAVVVDTERLACRFRTRDGDERTSVTVEMGECIGMYLAPGLVIEVQPFAACERLFGNRAMTTTVIIHPHPAPGLRVQVDLVSPIDGGVNSTEYLKAGDPQRTYHAHDGMAVHVSEVPDELMVPIENDGKSHDL